MYLSPIDQLKEDIRELEKERDPDFFTRGLITLLLELAAEIQYLRNQLDLDNYD